MVMKTLVAGHFGSGVASFFVFLRWLCFLNITLAVLIISFLVVPQVSAHGHSTPSDPLSSFSPPPPPPPPPIQVLIGDGLDVPAAVKATQSSYSFIFDGKVYHCLFSRII